MSFVSPTTKFVLALASTLAFAQQPVPSPAPQRPPQQERDLRVEKETSPAVAPAVPPKAAAPEQPAMRREIPRSYALVIGISEYQNLPPQQQLRYPNRDAESIYSILISPEGGNFRAENVHKLIGPAATLASMRRELESWLPHVSKADDRVLIYFAGHGFVDTGSGQAYLAPYDLKIDDIAGTGYSMRDLSTSIGSKIQAKWKVLLTDSCHSGAIAPDADVETINRSLGDLNKSLFSLTASRDRERSFESPDFGGGHGVFTYYVVQGLGGAADESRDGYVTADELTEYVRRNVREATGGKQNPTSDRGSFDANMMLAYVPANVQPEAPPAPKFGGLIFEANMDGVEVFVDGKSAGVVNKGAPLSLPGLPPGTHTVKGVKLGYEPDGPREETVYPGQDTTVSIKILIQRRRNKAAVDRLDKGIEYYTKGYAENYRKAVDEFQQALTIDPKYSQAALYLGRAYNALQQQEEAQKAFLQAIEIDPDYMEARAGYGGMLLDIGALDEAIRQLNTVVQRDPNHAMAWYLLSQAFCRKEGFEQSIDAANKAIALTPKNAEAHFWLADSLRMSGKWDVAKEEYDTYLRLSNFDSKLAGQLNYYVLGFLAGVGKKKRASQQDIWKDLRSWAYFGLCDCERRLSEFDSAIADCQRSLGYDSQDALTHWALGLVYALKAKQTGSPEIAAAARKHLSSMLALNPDLNEAKNAQQMIASIDAALQANR